MKSLQTHFTIIPRGTKDERSSKEARRGGQRVKDRHQLAGIKKKIEHRGFCPLVDGKKEQRNEKKKKKKKKRRYSGDKDRSLTPHCFPFSILLGHVAGSTFEFPAFFPICERVIRVKLRSLVQESLLRDKISLQNESNKTRYSLMKLLRREKEKSR